MILNTCIQGDCRDAIRSLIDDGVKVQCIVTSPPYWKLRDYGMPDQIGQEKTFSEYLENLKEVFGLCKDLLSDYGTLWLNMGDSYAGSRKGRNADGLSHHAGQKQTTNKGACTGIITGLVDFLDGKNLIGQPWRLAFALQEQGWYLRQDIIWHKPNPMPESVKDRCTKAHEYLFLLTKSPRYYFDQDAIRERLKDQSVARLIQDIEKQKGSNRIPGKKNGNMKAVCKQFDKSMAAGGSRIASSKHSGYFDKDGMPLCGTTANKKSVWTIPTQGFSGAHFAVMPEALVEPCVLAGSRAGDTVFDPFLGSGTVAQVAQRLGRNWLGVELNPDYIELQNKRTCQMGMRLV